MGIPNIDLYLVALFRSFFVLAQGEGQTLIDDLFEGHPQAEISSIKSYLRRHVMTSDTRQRSDDQPHIYFIENYPLADIPFPQICVTVGNETTSEHFLGDETGQQEIVTDSEGTVLAVDKENTVFSRGAWSVDVVASSKREVVWLSRLCQLAIFSNLDQLASVGLTEVDLSVADMRLDPQFYPQVAPARRISVTGLVSQTWSVRVEAVQYQSGINLAIDDNL